MLKPDAKIALMPVLVKKTRPRKRHYLILSSFVVMFVLPFAVAVAYLFGLSADQYHSQTAFSVRSKEFATPLDVLGAFTQTGNSTTADSEILNDYILSQPMVEALDAEFDLRTMFNRQPQDFIFSLRDAPAIEDLVDYWQRMVSVSVDSSTGVIELSTRAFSAQDSHLLAQAIIAKSVALINDLSRIAREDATKFAREDLETAEIRLKAIRLKVRNFRNAAQIIDPQADIASQMGVLSALENQLADALVEREVLLTYAEPDDPRATQLNRRIQAIRSQM